MPYIAQQEGEGVASLPFAEDSEISKRIERLAELSRRYDRALASNDGREFVLIAAEYLQLGLTAQAHKVRRGEPL